MNTGKTLFAQLMDFLPWTTFTRIGSNEIQRNIMAKLILGL